MQGRQVGGGGSVGVGQGEVGERATAVDATGRALGDETSSEVTGATAGTTVTAIMSDSPTSPADSGRLAEHEVGRR